ncbi:MAG: M18 family aminopeptidase [Lachnospiraceae bacterium]|jgi:aspartyl aminopeptidase|nr:M18 family aminopeptidase [Lachnospiraceae bacterium]
MEEKTDQQLRKLMRMLKTGTSAPLTVAEAARQLSEEGFEELEFQNTWGVKQGGKYFLKHHGTALIAFTVGENLKFRDSFRMAAAHTDYPCLRIKPNPDLTSEGYCRLNVEVYGGAILNTWLDRPLGLSGRVAVKSHDVMHPGIRLVDCQRPLMVIPNLAIHQNREINKGIELNCQTDLLPLVGTCSEEKLAERGLLSFLAEELGVKKEDILDYELWVTSLQQPEIAGFWNDFLVSPRLDNLTSVQALVSGIIQGNRDRGFNVIALFDHEEIGSRGKQGGASLLLPNVLEKICECFGWTSMQRQEAIYSSMLLSVDVAHGLHPNYQGKMDLTNHPVLNGGLCIKESSTQSYVTDCEAVAIVEQICQSKGISYQKYVNRSDIKGGSTLGGIVSNLVPVPTVDVGVPILAMHSSAETMGARDQAELVQLITSFFSL